MHGGLLEIGVPHKFVYGAADDAATLEKLELTFEVKAGPTGSLFGSVTATNVADEIWRTGKLRVDRRKIDLHDPIKRIGRYEVPIEVFTDVRVDVKTLVVPEGGELPPEEELAAAAAAEEAEAAAASADDAPEVESGAEPVVEAGVEQMPEDAYDPSLDADGAEAELDEAEA